VAPHGVYPCRGEDRWIAIAIGSDGEWRTLAGLIGVNDSLFDTVAGRIAHQDELDTRVAAWTEDQEANELMHRLQALSLDAGVAFTTRDIAQDEHYREREFVQAVSLPEAGKARYPRYGFQLSRTPVQTGAGPGFGEHNREVLGDLLGYSDSTLAGLTERRAIADRPLAPSELPHP
jgi:benzylsuccinate CoA-transferase BbsF subunit